MTKTPSSYSLIFAFSAIMFLLCFIGLYYKEQNAFGVVLWGYILWLMHKKKIEDLTKVFKYIFIFTFLLGIVGLFIIENFEISIFEYLLIISIGLTLQYILWKYFEKFDKKIEVIIRNETNLDKKSEIISDVWKIAYDEFESNSRNTSIWAKCFADANGDENVAKAKYLKIRVEQLGHQKVSNEDKYHNYLNSQSDSECKTNLNDEKSKTLSHQQSKNQIKNIEDIFFIETFAKNKQIDYNAYSTIQLILLGFFEISKYKNRNIILLHNDYCACVVGSLLKVFDNEKNLKKMLDSGKSSQPLHSGLIVSFDKNVFTEPEDENELKKLGITFDGKHYIFDGKRYEIKEEAIRYAKTNLDFKSKLKSPFPLGSRP